VAVSEWRAEPSGLRWRELTPEEAHTRYEAEAPARHQRYLTAVEAQLAEARAVLRLPLKHQKNRRLWRRTLVQCLAVLQREGRLPPRP
jgi:hypothetical protein